MARDTKHLRLHGRHWHVVVAVPRHLKARFGRSQLEQSLNTDSLTTARRRRGPVVDEFKRRIARAQQGQNEQLDAPPKPVAAGGVPGDPQWWRDYTMNDERLHRRDNNSIGVAFELEDLARDELLKIKAEHGIHAGEDWDGERRGTKTPLMLHRDEWLAVMAVKPKTLRDRRTTLSMFEEWASDKDRKYHSVQDISRRVAGDFLAQRLSVTEDGRRLDADTINKHLSALGLYWDWLAERGHLGDEPPANPWRKHITVRALSTAK